MSAEERDRSSLAIEAFDVFRKNDSILTIEREVLLDAGKKIEVLVSPMAPSFITTLHGNRSM